MLKAGFRHDSSMLALDQPYEVVFQGQARGPIKLPIRQISSTSVKGLTFSETQFVNPTGCDHMAQVEV
jgi:hypothetical protein